jgi:DnaJ-class molecular chaperone
MSDQGPRQQSTGSAGFQESCGVCGGDRRIGNSFGLTTTCPSCHGSGRRAEVTGFHDVTKTKPSHHRQPNRVVEAPAKPQWPTTFTGGELATEVRDSKSCPEATKAKLIREIIDYEGSHGQCTQTFVKKVRKQVRPHA